MIRVVVGGPLFQEISSSSPTLISSSSVLTVPLNFVSSSILKTSGSASIRGLDG